METDSKELMETSKNSPNTKQKNFNTNPKNTSFIKKCSLFDSKESEKLLNGIVEVVDGFQHDFDLNNQNDESPAKQNRAKNSLESSLTKNLNLSDKLYCTACNYALSVERDEQVEHYKGDWHLFNLKQKVKGKPGVSAEKFETLTDVSSISGSDSESGESSDSISSDESESNNAPFYAQVARNKPRISFKLADNSILVMLRCILHGKKNIPESQQDLLNIVKSIKANDRWCIILVAGGHFAAAIFEGDKVVVHKTFHRYVIRAKRGTVQSQHDSSGKFAKSAGANIRRGQEAAFKDDIRLLLGTEWKSEIEKCTRIFIRVPSYHKSVLISNFANTSNQNVAPFSKDDLRLRNIPFMTFRPTFNEVKRTHTILSKLEHFDASYLEFSQKLNSKIEKPKESDKKSSNKSSKTKQKLKGSKNVQENHDMPNIEPIQDQEEESDNNEEVLEEVEMQGPEVKTTNDDFIQSLNSSNLKIFNEIYTACLTNNVTKLEQLLSSPNDGQINFEILLNKRLNKENGFTLLHLVSSKGNADCIWSLLLNGANPALPDLTKKCRLPYYLSVNKQTKDQYRRFLNDYPDRYDYATAQITSPLSADKLNDKLEKEREKKRNQRKLKKQREAQQKNLEKEKELEMNERKRFLELSDQQKRSLIEKNFVDMTPLTEAEKIRLSRCQMYDKQSTAATNVKEALKVINRCYSCGLDITNITPFEYLTFKFCSTQCLRNHRLQHEQSQKKK